MFFLLAIVRRCPQEAGTEQHLGLDATLPVPAAPAEVWRGIRTQQPCRINPKCQMWRSVSRGKALNFHFHSLKGNQKERSSVLGLLSAVTLTHMRASVAAFIVSIKGCNSTVSTELYQISLDYGVYFYGSCCKRILAIFFFRF